jgi:long-chain fatty acid transport protein
LWWNPAAIGWDERSSASFGATAIVPNGRVEDAGTQIDRPGVAPVPVGGTPVQRDPVQKGVLPASAAALRLTDTLALGLAISSPYSFTTDYDPDGWQRYSAIRTRLITLDVQPSIAWAPSDRISIGAALNIEYSDAFLSNTLPNLAPGSPDARLRLTGSGIDLGWSVGAQLRPAPTVTLGIAYKSAIEHKLKGDVSISGLLGPLAARNRESDIIATFSTPWQLILGARVGLSEVLTLNAQAVHFGWSKFERIDLGTPLNSFIPQGYKNSWSFAVGADAALSPRLTLRGGIQFDGTPTRDDRRDPRVPDSDRVNYNAGASFRMSDRLTLDAAAAFTDFKTTPITRDERFYAGTAAQVDVFTEGRARSQRAIVLSMGGRIGF